MGIFKDLGFKKRNNEIVSPDTNKFNGKTYEEILSEVGSTPSAPSISPDVDGTITVNGDSLSEDVQYLTQSGVIGENGTYQSVDYTSSNVAIKGFLPDTGVYNVDLNYSSVSGTVVFDLVMSDDDTNDINSNLYYLSPIFRFFPISNGTISVEVDTDNGTITIDGTSKNYDKNKTSLIFGNDNGNSGYIVSISGNLPTVGGVTINQESEQGNWVQYKAEATNIDGDLYINDTLQIVESINGSVTTYTTQTTDTDQLTISTDGTVDSVSIDTWVAG